MIVDFAQIQHMAVHHAVARDTAVLDHAEGAMLLTVFPANLVGRNMMALAYLARHRAGNLLGRHYSRSLPARSLKCMAKQTFGAARCNITGAKPRAERSSRTSAATDEVWQQRHRRLSLDAETR